MRNPGQWLLAHSIYNFEIRKKQNTESLLHPQVLNMLCVKATCTVPVRHPCAVYMRRFFNLNSSLLSISSGCFGLSLLWILFENAFLFWTWVKPCSRLHYAMSGYFEFTELRTRLHPCTGNQTIVFHVFSSSTRKEAEWNEEDWKHGHMQSDAGN